MRDNSNDRTVERSYVQKWRFLIREYELVKAKKHTRFRFVQDFYKFHGTNRQTFASTTIATGRRVPMRPYCR